MNFKFLQDGFYNESNLDLIQVENQIIEVKCIGFPYRGLPREFAQEALSFISSMMHQDMSLSPVVTDSSSGTDAQGHYTYEVTFQAVRIG